jgi:hypothetical protein
MRVVVVMNAVYEEPTTPIESLAEVLRVYQNFAVNGLCAYNDISLSGCPESWAEIALNVKRDPLNLIGIMPA